MRASLVLFASTAAAFQAAAPQSQTTALCATRSDVLKSAAAAAALYALPAQAAQRTASGLVYEIQKSNPKGNQPKKGDLIAVRFKGSTVADGNVFDDTMKTDEPFYYRVGAGNLMAGIEEILPVRRPRPLLFFQQFGEPRHRDDGVLVGYQYYRRRSPRVLKSRRVTASTVASPRR